MKPVFPKKIPTGWSTWQYYRRNITENDVIENITALKKGKYPIGYILTDDGYANNSNWLKTNNKFPHGSKWIASKIKNAGYKPGLWIAPLTRPNPKSLLNGNPESKIHDSKPSPTTKSAIKQPSLTT